MSCKDRNLDSVDRDPLTNIKIGYSRNAIFSVDFINFMHAVFMVNFACTQTIKLIFVEKREIERKVQWEEIKWEEYKKRIELLMVVVIFS